MQRSASWPPAPWPTYSEVKMDRRTFLKTTAAGGALVTVGGVTIGCGNDVAAAPRADVKTVMDNPGTLSEAVLINNPALAATYGTIMLQVETYPDLVPVGGA